MHPTEVLEGSLVNIICDLGFKISGNSSLMCENGKLGALPSCIPIKMGRYILYGARTMGAGGRESCNISIIWNNGGRG